MSISHLIHTKKSWKFGPVQNVDEHILFGTELNMTKFRGLFGVDQMAHGANGLCLFWTRPNVLYGWMLPAAEWIYSSCAFWKWTMTAGWVQGHTGPTITPT